MTSYTSLPSLLSVLSQDMVINRFILLNRYPKGYWVAFIVALLLCWSPSKFAGYLAPWLAIGLYVLITRSRQVFQRLILVLGVWLMLLPLYSLLTPEFAFHSAALTLLTYGAWLFFFVVPTKHMANPRLLSRMLSLTRFVILFQGTWGIGQAVASFATRGTFDGSAGDVVAGTIRPFSITSDFSNPMFAVNMALLLLLSFPSLIKDRKGLLVLCIGLFSLILASVLHVLLFLSVAIAAAFVLCFPSFFLKKRGIYLLIGAIVSGLIAFTLLGNNFATVRSFAQYTVDGKTTRAQVVTDVFAKMPQTYFWMPVIGLGPGQFTSRASLIGTGLYFGGPGNPRPIPLLPQGMSRPFREYILGPWLSLTTNGINNSSTSQPYFSWLSVYTEFGVIGFLLITAAVMRVLYKLQRLSRVTRPREKIITVSVSAAIIFLYILGIQENYWEVSQAIFVGLILLKMEYPNLVHAVRRNWVVS